MNPAKAFVCSLTALIVLMSLALVGTSHADNSPPARVGRISYLSGEVSFLPAGQQQWSQATLNYVVTTGDRIYTDKRGRAEIEFGPYAIRLNDESDLVITDLTDQIMQLGLEQGTMCLIVKQLSNETVEVDTPHGALTARAPGSYRVDISGDGTETRVRVDRGELLITGQGISETVETGRTVALTGEDPIQVRPVSMPPRDGFDAWCEERDQRLASSKSVQYVSPSTPGYEELDANGRWVEMADYGPVWFPTEAISWVPFRFGHWAWIGPWGWTWIEDEPWGFCPFHYGRWVFVAGAWGWMPGPVVTLPVFTPGLVAFVGGPNLAVGVNANLVGWFPLGPAEPFFPWYHCTADYLRIVNITNIRNVTDITNIINLTNINNVHYSYRTIATTVVPSDVLRNGLHVANHIVKVPPERLMRAQVIPHPWVNPTLNAALPGRPVHSPPVRVPGPMARTVVHPEPPVVRAPASIGRPAPTPVEHPPFVSRPLIARQPLPPPPIPLSRMQETMAAHPGRPPEPLQLENLRAGKPPGPMLDHEFPPHVEPMPRPIPNPQAKVPARHR